MHSSTAEFKNMVNQTQVQVMQLLGWDAMQYGTLMEEQGREYLHRYIGNDPVGIRYLEGSAIFWQWWKNHWQNRDKRFLLFNTHIKYKENLIIRYQRHHAAKYLVSDIYPPAVVLGNDYAKMIGELNDAIKQ